MLDLGAGCVLRESLRGYCAALGEDAAFCAEDLRGWHARFRTVILPGLGIVDEAVVSNLLELLGAGANVLLESGGGFLSAPDFVIHQIMLRESFGFIVEEPIDVWSNSDSVPYIDYLWPQAMMVRDFSRVVPLSAQTEGVIARLGTLPVAAKRQFGGAILMILGSPLGPCLRAGDREARAWLHGLKSTIRGFV